MCDVRSGFRSFRLVPGGTQESHSHDLHLTDGMGAIVYTFDCIPDALEALQATATMKWWRLRGQWLSWHDTPKLNSLTRYRAFPAIPLEDDQRTSSSWSFEFCSLHFG
jgi:hypothetical protein